ncbi:hypothetical protein MHI43_15585 [Paenibacillus sp. FSL H8-0457]|uniref:hypothetical protein n=1 Tax=Bacillales TaxID=1385 RepID=UPI0003E22236|nr:MULTISPECIES: hypothetical protein [Paenibacillus]ETT62033.1 hypothetical protein C172_16386 [Paenibacillus sp. FSL H8-457]MCM3257796.1 hypothetical protein [Paenibacillus lautus]
MERKQVFEFNGKRKLFGKFLLSYVLILLIPLLVGAYPITRRFRSWARTRRS